MPDRAGLLRRLSGVALLLCCAGPLNAGEEAVDAALAAAAAAAERGDGIAAEAAVRKALSAGAPRSAVAARMGEAQLLQGDLRKAGEWLSAGDFSGPDQALGWRMKGLLLRLEGKLPAAGQALDRALQFAPRDAELWTEIARLRYAGGEQILAIEAAERALAFGPENPRAIELRARMLHDQTGPIAAIPLYERGLQVAPEDVPLLTGYAGALAEAGRAADMLVVARQLYRIDPRSPVPFYLQALIAAQAGRVDLARSLLTRIGNRLSDVAAVQLLQAALELEAGNYTLAVEMLERLDLRQPHNQRVQLLYARALLAAGDHRRLYERFAAIAEEPGAPAYLLAVLGRSLEQSGDRAGAAPLLDRAAQAGALPFTARRADFEQARPGVFAGYVQAGDRSLLAKDKPAALAAFQRAATIRYPEWLMLRIAFASGDQAEGGRIAAQYLAAFPASLMAPRLAALDAGQRGDWGRAAVLLGHADRRLGHGDAQLLAELALAQLRSGVPDAALASAEAAYGLNRASAVAAQVRGMALIALRRDPELATSLLDKAEQLGGGNAMLTEARAQLAAP